MSKLEIICYIISAFFIGMSAGCFISVSIHNSIYGGKIKPLKPRGFRAWFNWRRRKDKLQDIDEMHEHRDDNIREALKLGMSQKTRQVQTFHARVGSFINIDEGLTPEHERCLLRECCGTIAWKMVDEGALTFRVDPCTRYNMPDCKSVQYIEMQAEVDVVMPDKEGET